MEQFKDLVTITPWHMIMMLGNLLILTLIVKKLLFDRVQKVLNERQARADAMLADAKKAKDTAEAEKADYEAHLAAARQEAADLLEQAGKTAAARSEQTLEAARQQAAQMKQKAEAEIEQARKKALNDAKDEIGGMAMAIASKVVEREISEADHKALIDEFIEKVGDAS
ncbi:MAG TPA: F0F1 ATP synthase subunit B [Candidatus Fournierella merdavium]|uniref:F0F1 ATP synthase subunit B n=1 Tax=Candidatus Allofournierella merdavium TaxID=2838593 RepID=UPI001F8C9CFC|nr:F0F1 ATP synthase subunit B [Candidatus Fournierella merdavium]